VDTDAGLGFDHRIVLTQLESVPSSGYNPSNCR
jgi:hypothetical protein